MNTLVQEVFRAGAADVHASEMDAASTVRAALVIWLGACVSASVLTSLIIGTSEAGDGRTISDCRTLHYRQTEVGRVETGAGDGNDVRLKHDGRQNGSDWPRILSTERHFRDTRCSSEKSGRAPTCRASAGQRPRQQAMISLITNSLPLMISHFLPAQPGQTFSF